MKHYLSFLFASLIGGILALAGCSSDSNNGSALSVCNGQYYNPEYQRCVDGELADGPEISPSSSSGGGNASSSSGDGSPSSSSGGASSSSGGGIVGACYLGYIEGFYGCAEYMSNSWSLRTAQADCSLEDWQWLDACPKGDDYNEYEPETDIHYYIYYQNPLSGSEKYCLWYGECFSENELSEIGFSCAELGGITYPNLSACSQ
jgi:hypothetical protein